MVMLSLQTESAPFSGISTVMRSATLLITGIYLVSEHTNQALTSDLSVGNPLPLMVTICPFYDPVVADMVFQISLGVEVII